jgi:rare lipoprotein A
MRRDAAALNAPCVRVAPKIAALTILFALGACSSVPRGGGYFEDDGPGAKPPDVANTPDAVPRTEPRAARGNKPYKVYGIAYTPLTDTRGYRERGVASWYGKKFHGRLTSSGEPYDMYAMTAAHKTLPLPSYVRVRNLKNGRSAVVRVNDRGPFLHNRLIDLSYAAAAKLGIVGTGTGEVEIETIDPDNDAPSQIVREEKRKNGLISTAEAAPTPQWFVQIGAFRDPGNAEALRTRLERAAFTSTSVHAVTGTDHTTLYRVRIGPLTSAEEGDRVAEDLARHGVADALIVVE